MNQRDVILHKLEIYWREYPELRLCQILCDAARQQGWKTTDIYCVEDNMIEQWLDQRLDGLP